MIMASPFLYRPIAGKVASCVSRHPGRSPSVIKGQIGRASSSGTAGDDQNTTHFPWRHQSTLPERFADKDDLSGMPNNVRARFLRRFLACRELEMSPLDAVPLPFGFVRGWEDEMAQHFATAFGLALEELLKSIFPGAVVLRDNGGGISIDTSITNEAESSGLMGNEYLLQMMDRELIAQFQSVDPNELHLKLSMRPINAELQFMFVVPMLSREIVEKKPHLKGAYLRIEKAFEEKKSVEEVKRMTYELAREIGQDDVYKRTVVADATIACSEFFQVKDASTGAVLHGMQDDEEEEETVHNVRYEMVTERRRGETGRESGNWKVIDVDDLLEGNVFH